MTIIVITFQTPTGADPGFPVGVAPTLQEGASTYDFAKIFQKLHEIAKILSRRGHAGSASLRSATAQSYIILTTACSNESERDIFTCDLDLKHSGSRRIEPCKNKS